MNKHVFDEHMQVLKLVLVLVNDIFQMAATVISTKSHPRDMKAKMNIFLYFDIKKSFVLCAPLFQLEF